MTEKSPSSELSALINLIDEPDENAFHLISEKIFSFGKEAIPVLEKAWENSFDSIVQERVSNILKSIHRTTLQTEFAEWMNLDSSDLLKGFILVSRTEYPELDHSHHHPAHDPEVPAKA